VVTYLRTAHASVLLCAALLAAGCRQSPAPVANAGPVRHYPISGKVVGTNAESGEVELAANPVPGFMDAMTMPYQLKTPHELSKLRRGDVIAGVLDVGGSGTVIDQIQVTDRSKELNEPVSQSQLKPIVPGEAVPNFVLLDQDKKLVHLADFKGKVLLVTFIYTHCPLSDFCPRMSRNFADVDQALAAVPELYGRTHLLSISFDPSRDTPAVLRSYGGAYTGKYTTETFKHWSFAAPRQVELAPMLDFFDLGSIPAPNGTLTHTLSTVVIGPDGKVVKWYPGNQWTAAEMMADVQKALDQKTVGQKTVDQKRPDASSNPAPGAHA